MQAPFTNFFEFFCENLHKVLAIFTAKLTLIAFIQN
jgi:hypothetical protein